MVEYIPGKLPPIRAKRRTKTILNDLLTRMEDKMIASGQAPSDKELKTHAQLMDNILKMEKVATAKARTKLIEVRLEMAELKLQQMKETCAKKRADQAIEAPLEEMHAPAHKTPTPLEPETQGDESQGDETQGDKSEEDKHLRSLVEPKMAEFRRLMRLVDEEYEKTQSPEERQK